VVDLPPRTGAGGMLAPWAEKEANWPREGVQQGRESTESTHDCISSRRWSQRVRLVIGSFRLVPFRHIKTGYRRKGSAILNGAIGIQRPGER